MLLSLCGDIQLNPGPKSENLISLCHANIRSLRSPNRFLHVQLDLANKYDVISLSETWLGIRDSSDFYHIPGYQPLTRRDRNHGQAYYGGVAAWVKDSIPFKRRLDLECDEIELMWLELTINKQTLLVGIVYNPPNSVDFWKHFNDNINNILENKLSKIIILGDLNADPASPCGKNLSDFCIVNSFVALVKEPTRITETSCKILDQCLTNYETLIKSCNVSDPVHNSDHCLVSVILNLNSNKSNNYNRLMWDFKNADFAKFRNILLNTNWNEILLNNAEQNCIRWTEKILETAKSCVPNKNVLIRSSDKAWFNSQLRKLRKNLLRKFNKYCISLYFRVHNISRFSQHEMFASIKIRVFSDYLKLHYDHLFSRTSIIRDFVLKPRIAKIRGSRK